MRSDEARHPREADPCTDKCVPEHYVRHIPVAKTAGKHLLNCKPDSGDGMAVIFKMEYHPIGRPPRRIRVLEMPDTDRIRRVTEERRDGVWTEIDAGTIDYFEYADESG